MSYQDLSRAIAEEKEYMEEWRRFQKREGIDSQTLIDKCIITHDPLLRSRLMETTSTIMNACIATGMKSPTLGSQMINEALLTGMISRAMSSSLAETLTTNLMKQKVLHSSVELTHSTRTISYLYGMVSAFGPLNLIESLFTSLCTIMPDIEKQFDSSVLEHVHETLHCLPCVEAVSFGTSTPPLQYPSRRVYYAHCLQNVTDTNLFRLTNSHSRLFRVEGVRAGDGTYVLDIEIPIFVHARLPSGKRVTDKYSIIAMRVRVFKPSDNAYRAHKHVIRNMHLYGLTSYDALGMIHALDVSTRTPEQQIDLLSVYFALHWMQNPPNPSRVRELVKKQRVCGMEEGLRYIEKKTGGISWEIMCTVAQHVAAGMVLDGASEVSCINGYSLEDA